MQVNGVSKRSVRQGTVAAAALAIVLAGTLAGCSGSSNSSADPTGSASGAGSASDTSSPSADASASASRSADASPSGTASRGPDPTMGPYKPVERPGSGTRSVTAAPTPFDSSVRYGDGLRLGVTDVTQSKSTAQGPGSFPGDPVTRIGLKMTNGSKGRLDVDQVVVTALYGSARRQARPVYDARSRDFSGTIDPGGTATAVYSFSVPTAQLGSVRMIVDFDGVHSVATFTGDPRTAD